MIIWVLAATAAVFAVISISLFVLLVDARGTRTQVRKVPGLRRDDGLARDPAAPLDRMDLGVIVLNRSLVPVAANPAARRLLRLSPGGLPARLQSNELHSVARRVLNTGEPAETDFNLWPDHRRIRARVVDGDTDEITVFLDDVTEEIQAQQIRRQFVVNASHELKTPVAGIQALAETVNQAIEDDPDAAKRFARKLLIESERLSRLIQDLLDLSRLEDPTHFSTASVDLAAIAEREAEGLRQLAEDRSVKLDANVVAGVVVRGDEQQMRLMVRNLVDNAIRYTPAGGSVTVSVELDHADAVLEVEDTGVGIPLNAQSRVFERFFRVDADRARDSGGTGLGLSIVKHVAEMHGGHVSLHSELGEGSTFRVRLPLPAENRS